MKASIKSRPRPNRSSRSKQTSATAPSRGPVGVIGLGLMGRGIVTCLLSQGMEVVAYTRSAATRAASEPHIRHALNELAQRGIVPRSRIKGWRRPLHLVSSVAELAPCGFVIESVKEEFALKQEIFAGLERCLAWRRRQRASRTRKAFIDTRNRTPEWEKTWVDFTHDIRRLADKYTAAEQFHTR